MKRYNFIDKTAGDRDYSKSLHMGNTCHSCNCDRGHEVQSLSMLTLTVRGFSPELDPQARKIQALYRGHMVRREILTLRTHSETASFDTCSLTSYYAFHKPNKNFSIPYSGESKSFGIDVRLQADGPFINPYPNKLVEKTLEKLGGFEYTQKNESDTREVFELPPYQILANNAIYIGQWRYGTRYGKGKQIWPDGSIYEGTWKKNVAHGFGRFVYADGSYYIGEWANDKIEGQGKFVHVNGSSYEGEWKNNLHHGYGVETQTDGSRYQGGYQEGEKEGRGKFFWVDGSYYSGELVAGMFQGKGRYEFADKRIYDGEWKMNKMHGYGTFIWPDGRKYEGNYVEDLKQGYGVFSWPDGGKYKGNWDKGKQHGNGIFISKTGKKQAGEWNEGQIVRWINDYEDEAEGLLAFRNVERNQSDSQSQDISKAEEEDEES